MTRDDTKGLLHRGWIMGTESSVFVCIATMKSINTLEYQHILLYQGNGSQQTAYIILEREREREQRRSLLLPLEYLDGRW
jgi:hypothetical protein